MRAGSVGRCFPHFQVGFWTFHSHSARGHVRYNFRHLAHHSLTHSSKLKISHFSCLAVFSPSVLYSIQWEWSICPSVPNRVRPSLCLSKLVWTSLVISMILLWYFCLQTEILNPDSQGIGEIITRGRQVCMRFVIMFSCFLGTLPVFFKLNFF